VRSTAPFVALLAASELFRATHKPAYKAAADARAASLVKRLAPGPRFFWPDPTEPRLPPITQPPAPVATPPAPPPGAK